MLRQSLIAMTMAVGLTTGAVAEPAKVLVPAGPGGGYDTTTRLALGTLDKLGLFKDGAVFTNKTGAGGTLGLGEFIRTSKGQDNALMGMGIILLGSIIVTPGAMQIAETTPIARLTFEHNGVAVPANSAIKTVKDLTDAIKANPGAVAFGGGSAGGVDHIIAGTSHNKDSPDSVWAGKSMACAIAAEPTQGHSPVSVHRDGSPPSGLASGST
jgi:putative tricarboxylic transport membrane protein